MHTKFGRFSPSMFLLDAIRTAIEGGRRAFFRYVLWSKWRSWHRKRVSTWPMTYRKHMRERIDSSYNSPNERAEKQEKSTIDLRIKIFCFKLIIKKNGDRSFWILPEQILSYTSFLSYSIPIHLRGVTTSFQNPIAWYPSQHYQSLPTLTEILESTQFHYVY